MKLSAALRTRVVSLVAASLGEVTPLPASLKQVAGFAPARRARLGATAIMGELERDGELRERVATQVRVRATEDELDVAALAWLERTEGWEDAVRRVAERPSKAPDSGRQGQREQKLKERADEAERTLREARRSHKEALDALKAEVATLRRTLGETRARERSGREEADAARTRAEEAAARLDRELRQARATIARLEEQAAEQRRRDRVDRDDTTVRARMLLDTLGDAVAGLRRELALPATAGSPAQRLEETYTEPEGPAQGQLVEDAGRLAQFLALPRPRLLVDGYNVTKTVWPTQSLEAQRTRLLALLGALTARTGAETTVVFDGSDTARATVAAPRGVKVIFSPSGVIADDVIRELVAAEPQGRVMVVVTDDQALGADVRRAGATVARVRALV